MKRLIVALAGFGAIALLGSTFPAQARAQPDLEAALRLHYQAVNRGDVVAATASFTDDAVLSRGACSPLAPCTGRAEIQQQIQAEITNRVSFGVLSSRVSGSTVTGYSYSYFQGRKYYVICKLDGEYNSKTKSIK